MEGQKKPSPVSMEKKNFKKIEFLEQQAKEVPKRVERTPPVFDGCNKKYLFYMVTVYLLRNIDVELEPRMPETDPSPGFKILNTEEEI
ncbi:hypothetical protein BpHYR1_043126 [Brachionus plicatilis]|uniref:Uncharacterized protein n=1 Tax=Brachionus plicatilis TaxID=10195 RepID=A0A3M7QZ58_BRAPC|nr:hypothetical protein BpHYR1_043126 [Brachionus plicatilis]